MNLLYMMIEVLASTTETLLILNTGIHVSEPIYSMKEKGKSVCLCTAIITTYITCINTWFPFSFLTPIGSIIFSAFAIKKVLSNGKWLPCFTVCVLAMFVIQSIDYILVTGYGLLLGNPRKAFYDILVPGKTRMAYLLVDKSCDALLYYRFRPHITKLAQLRNKSIVWLFVCTVLAYSTMQYLAAMMLYGNFIQLQGAALISFSALLCFIIILAFSMIAVTSSEQEKATNRLLTTMNQMMENNYYLMNQSIMDNAKGLHDFRHHLAVINSLAQKEYCRSITEYVASISSSYLWSAHLCRSGSDIIDAIINTKLVEAKQKKIQFEYTTTIQDLASFEPADICGVLANQLENAFEACENIVEDRKVTLDIQQHEGFVLFKVTNSVAKNPFQSNSSLVSTKAGDSKTHGLGLRNIRDISQKYNGRLESKYIDGVFISTVLICSPTN